MTLLSTVTDTPGVVRALTNALAAFSFIPTCWVTMIFIFDKKGAHRWLHVTALIYFACRCAVHVWVLIDYYGGLAHIPGSVNLISTLSEIAFATAYFITRKDLALAYQYDPTDLKQVAMNQEIVKSLRTSAQKAVLVEHMAGKRVEEQDELKELIANVGRP